MGLHWSPPDFWDLWKAISIGLTGLFGVLGLLTNYKDKVTGRITGWGKLNLAGIILSAAMGMLSQWVDTQRKTRSAEESAVKAQKAADLANETANRAGAAAGNTERLIGDLLQVSRRTEAIARGTDRSVSNSAAAAKSGQQAASATLGIAKGTAAAVAASQAGLARIERLLSPFSDPQLEMRVWMACTGQPADDCRPPKAEDIGTVRASISSRPPVIRFGYMVGGDVEYFGNAQVHNVGLGLKFYDLTVPLRMAINRSGLTSYLDLPGKTLYLLLGHAQLAWSQVRSIELRTRDGQIIEIPRSQATPIAGIQNAFSFRYTFPSDHNPRYQFRRPATPSNAH